LIFLVSDVKVEFLARKLSGDPPTMKNEQHKEDWLKLCELAAVEQDPERLLALTQEICRLLDERENTLKKGRQP
jgi:hypothetical protein